MSLYLSNQDNYSYSTIIKDFIPINIINLSHLSIPITLFPIRNEILYILRYCLHLAFYLNIFIYNRLFCITISTIIKKYLNLSKFHFRSPYINNLLMFLYIYMTLIMLFFLICGIGLAIGLSL